MTIGDRIKERRNKLNMTPEELAATLGKSRATIYRYENGDIKNLPTTILEPLAKALYTTPAYLMGWTDDYHDWEQIGNDAGIYPPADYDGSYEDFVKFKTNEQQESLLDSKHHLDKSLIPSYQDNFSSLVRAAARDMMDLSPEDQKTAIDLIKFLSQKGKEAKKY